MQNVEVPRTDQRAPRRTILSSAPPRHIPAISTLVALTVLLALASAFVVGVATQPRSQAAGSGAPCRQIEGLVLDGSGVTTTAPLSSAGRPIEQIPYRTLGDPVETTTTTVGCG